MAAFFNSSSGDNSSVCAASSAVHWRAVGATWGSDLSGPGSSAAAAVHCDESWLQPTAGCRRWLRSSAGDVHRWSFSSVCWCRDRELRNPAVRRSDPGVACLWPPWTAIWTGLSFSIDTKFFLMILSSCGWAHLQLHIYDVMLCLACVYVMWWHMLCSIM